MAKIKIIKGSELPIVEDINKATFLAYEDKTISLKSGRIDLKALTPLFGVRQQSGTDILAVMSQDAASRTTREAIQFATDAQLKVRNIEVKPVSYQFINFPLKKGISYDLTLIPNAVVTSNIRWHKYDGTIVSGGTFGTVTTAGKTIQIVPDDDYDYFEVYFGSTSSTTQAELLISGGTLADELGFSHTRPISQIAATNGARHNADFSIDNIASFRKILIDKVGTGSNKLINFPLKKGYDYKIRLSSETENILSCNLYLYDFDGVATAAPFGGDILAGEVREMSYTPYKDIDYMEIYFGSRTEIGGSALFQVEYIPIIKDDDTAEVFGEADNIFFDPMMLSEGKFEDDTFKYSSAVGAVSYEKGKITIPAGGFLGLVLSPSALGWTLGADGDYFNALCKCSLATGGVIALGVDTSKAGSFGSTISLSADSKHNGWQSVYNRTHSTSLSDSIRIQFDNRESAGDMVVEEFYLWLGQNISPFGMFNKTIAEIDNRTKKVTPETPTVFINYAPYYTAWNHEGGITKSEIARNSFRIEGGILAGGGVFYRGFRFSLSKSDFKIGDTINWGVKNGKSDGTAALYCIFYDSSNKEIRRGTVSLKNDTEIVQGKTTIPDGTAEILVRFQSMSSLTMSYISGEEFYLTRDIIPTDNYEQIRQPLLDESSSDKNTTSFAWVDPLNGDDTNNGAYASPVKTVAKAQDITGDVSVITIKGDCDIEEVVNIRRKTTQRELTIQHEAGKRVRFVNGTKIRSGSFVDGLPNVYSVPMDSFPTQNNYWLFQHDIIDENTLISFEDRHPAQRGKYYACDSSLITRASSVDVVKTSTHRYYYDTDAKVLYFSVKGGTNLADNPVVIPSGNGIYGNNNTVKLNLIGLDFLYARVNVSRCSNADIIDCAALYAHGAGGFTYDMSVGIHFVRCEAARTFTGNGTGDGFNGHSTYPTFSFAKCTTATFTDCWGHHNADDNFSDHENCESTFFGGCWEWGNKGGCTPAYGGHSSFYGCTFQNNKMYGLGLVGGVAAAEGGYGGQSIAVNCISRRNGKNYYCAGDNTTAIPNKLTLIGCFSGDAVTSGYEAGRNGIIETYDCTDKDSPTPKSEVYNGKVYVYNGTPLIA